VEVRLVDELDAIPRHPVYGGRPREKARGASPTDGCRISQGRSGGWPRPPRISPAVKVNVCTFA
jgi:hypothetical protein